MASVVVSKDLVMTAEDRGSDRMYAEQQKLKKYFPQFSMVGVSSRVTGAKGSLRTNSGNFYTVRITLPSDYPYSIPKVDPDGWTGKGPHIYQSGSLCVWKSEDWTPTYTIAWIVAKTALWLNKYDVWRDTGKWPGRQQFHGLAGFFQEWFG